MNWIMIFSTMASVTLANGANIDASFRERITKACVKSVELGNKKITNYKLVCACIAKTHFDSAEKEPKAKDALAHIDWAVNFYESMDLAHLQKLSDQNPKLSAYDDMVVDDCLQSSNVGPRK